MWASSPSVSAALPPKVTVLAAPVVLLLIWSRYWPLLCKMAAVTPAPERLMSVTSEPSEVSELTLMLDGVGRAELDRQRTRGEDTALILGGERLALVALCARERGDVDVEGADGRAARGGGKHALVVARGRGRAQQVGARLQADGCILELAEQVLEVGELGRDRGEAGLARREAIDRLALDLDQRFDDGRGVEA